MQQNSLFPEFSPPQVQTFSLPDGQLTLHHGWLPAKQSDHLFAQLLSRVAWEQSIIQVYGREVAIPRLNAWFGDRDCDYAYSGHRLQRHDWIQPLAIMRLRLQKELSSSFNSVLANYYRTGEDSVGWHSDNEPELGRNPTIASVSLGVERRFCLKHRHRRDIEPIQLLLPSGSLLVMAGSLQHHWYHALPKQRKVLEPRINLTFRRVWPKSSTAT